jgi:hypothetical protein
MSVIIDCELYRTDDGHDPLPRTIGPFASRGEADDWVTLQGPLWGSWSVITLVDPRSLYPGATDIKTHGSTPRRVRFGLSNTPPPEVAPEPVREVPALRVARQPGED